MHIVLLHFYSQRPNPIYQQIAEALRRRGHRVWVGVPDQNDDLVWYDGEQAVARLAGPNQHSGFLALPGLPGALRNRLSRLAFILRLRRFLRSRGPDVVQINPASMHWIWLFPLAMPRATRFILDWRQVGQRGGQGVVRTTKAYLTNLWRRIYTRSYDFSCFLHEAGAEKVLGNGWQRRGRIVPLAVDRQFLQVESPVPVTMSARGIGATTVEPLRFLYIGSLSRVRRLERLIEAAGLLAAEGLTFQLDLVGPDNADGYYQQLIEAQGLQDHVAVLPPVPYAAVPETVLRYDVALAYVPEYPADWQYHPTVKVLEYRAVGVPIIASDFAPNREVVQRDVNGLLVGNEPAALAAGMQKFICDPAFFLRCKENAQQMRQGTTWREVAELYETVYKEGRHLLAT